MTDYNIQKKEVADYFVRCALVLVIFGVFHVIAFMLGIEPFAQFMQVITAAFALFSLLVAGYLVGFEKAEEYFIVKPIGGETD